MGHAIITAPLCDQAGLGEDEGSARANYKPPSYKETEGKTEERRPNGSKNAKRLREEEHYKR